MSFETNTPLRSAWPASSYFEADPDRLSTRSAEPLTFTLRRETRSPMHRFRLQIYDSKQTGPTTLSLKRGGHGQSTLGTRPNGPVYSMSHWRKRSSDE
jgi:hypothetical protein